MRLVLSILTLLAVVLHGVAPVSAFGVIASCPAAVTASAADDGRPACCVDAGHRETRHSEPSSGSCKHCQACLCCKVAPTANVSLISPLSAVAAAQPVGDVLANDSLRYVSVSTIPDVPPPKA